MTGGEYCSIYGCSSSRKTKNLGIFTVPTKAAAAKNPQISKWREELIGVVKRDRQDPELLALIAKDRVRICERHFDEKQYWTCKWCLAQLASFVVVFTLAIASASECS